MADGRIAEAEVRAALDALLRTPPFARSPKLARFLRFVVEEELAGRGAAIKAYTIATQALGRGCDFDPSLDPSVRVEAGRLRRALDEGYARAGRDLGIRIRIPVGSYRPLFEATTLPPEPVSEAEPAAEEPLVPLATLPAPVVVAFTPGGQRTIIALLAGILLMLCIEVALMLAGRVPAGGDAARGVSLAEGER